MQDVSLTHTILETMPLLHLLFHYLLLLTSLAITTQATPPRPQTYAALGDSYAAGGGAGLPLSWCGRFSDAYPIQVANNTHLNIQPFGFYNLACGGATTSSVHHSQFPYVDDADLVTVTVGGNEANFFRVLNGCVFLWKPVGSCEEEIVRARGMVRG